MPDLLPELNRFEKVIENKKTGLFFLRNRKNSCAAITNYGARWVSMLVPDNKNSLTDVIVGFDSIEGYINSTEAYYGAIVGRYANRIARGLFNLEGRQYKLAVNNPPNHLHGGIKGFHAVVWDVVSVTDNSISLRYVSADEEEGYPGTLVNTVTYLLTDENELSVTFTAETDKSTVVNLAHHAYFNLNGQGSGTILNHLLQINADHFTPIDSTSIPTGEIAPVMGTAFDFTEPAQIGVRINEPSEQLQNGTGYDHNFVLRDPGNIKNIAASVTGDISGIQMEIFTTEPGIQLYTGNFMNKENILKGGVPDGKREAFCLETQHFPDSPNQLSFPSVVLKPGDTYRSQTIFLFTTL